MVPPPHHLFLRWNQKPRPPVRGFSLWNSPLQGEGPREQQTPLSPSGEGRRICGLGRLEPEGGYLAPPSPQGRQGLFRFSREPRASPALHTAPPNAITRWLVLTLRERLEAPALPRGFFLLRRTASP